MFYSKIRSNYLHFDGFVVLTGTDTMAYMATALSFMLENLGKPVVFTGSQIPLCEPYNDARRNLIMAMIFAARDSINEVTIFFHDRLLRANRATKVNTHRLLAFDSPNLGRYFTGSCVDTYLASTNTKPLTRAMNPCTCRSTCYYRDNNRRE